VTQAVFGAGALKQRFNKSPARRPVPSLAGIVVRTFRDLTRPLMPSWRISRATCRCDSRTPSVAVPAAVRFSQAVIFRRP
jgi:hypothetical protein